MRYPILSACSYPTTSVFIDDNSDFLKLMELTIDDKPCLFFNDPADALEFFNHKYKSDPFIEHCIHAVKNEVNPDHVALEVNIRSIHNEIYNIDRFQQISTIFVDYGMPSMNGLDFLKEFNEPYIRRILLTGEAGHDVAVQAFNCGAIDGYISKGTVNLAEKIKSVQLEQEVKYFLNLTRILFSNSPKNKQAPLFLEDPIFVEFFNDFRRSHHVLEYYLMDNTGSYLLINEEGKVSWFAVKSEEELNELFKHAQVEEIQKQVIKSLKEKKKLLFLPGDMDLEISPSEWHAFLYPASQLQGKETYYYSYIDNLKAYDKHLKKMSTFESYMESIEHLK